MSIMVVIGFGAIFLVGVIFVIVGKSMDKEKQTVYKPNDSDEFDRDLIKKRVLELQNSPNLLTAYVKALTIKFQRAAEIMGLSQILAQNDLLSKLHITEKVLLKALKSKVEAETELDIVRDSEFKNVKKTDKIMTFKESIAQKEANIRNLGIEKNDYAEMLKKYKNKKEFEERKKDVDEQIRNRRNVKEKFENAKTINAIKAEANRLRSIAYEKHANGEITEKQLEKELQDIAQLEEHAIDSIL